MAKCPYCKEEIADLEKCSYCGFSIQEHEEEVEFEEEDEEGYNEEIADEEEQEEENRIKSSTPKQSTKSMTQCPKCKEKRPLLSKICPVCGYSYEDEEAGITAEAFIDELEEVLSDIKSIPEPSFLKSMSSLSVVIYPLLAAFLAALALISEAGLFWLLFLLFAVLSLVSIILKLTGRLGNDPFNRLFKSLINDFEKGERQAKRNFGKSREVTVLLNEISLKIEEIKEHRQKMARKNLLAWLVIMGVIVALSTGGVISINGMVEAAMPAAQKVEKLLSEGEWKQALELFKERSREIESMEMEALHAKTVESILKDKKAPEAEAFFLSYCMGETGDFDCATQIVEYYNRANEREAAIKFVQQCTRLRYQSDGAKLKKMIR